MNNSTEKPCPFFYLIFLDLSLFEFETRPYGRKSLWVPSIQNIYVGGC